MIERHTWQQVFGGAEAVRHRAGAGHVHPHWYTDCVYCACLGTLHGAALDFLAQRLKEPV
jgi:hypothetical protein